MDRRLLLLLIAGSALLALAQDDPAAAEGGDEAPAEDAAAAAEDAAAPEEGAAAEGEEAATEAPVTEAPDGDPANVEMEDGGVDEASQNVTTPAGNSSTEAPGKAASLGFSAAVTVITVSLAFYL